MITVDEIQIKAVQDVLDERARQDAKWGVQDHLALCWLAILAEEFGEFAKHANEDYWRPSNCDRYAMRQEAVQVAAVALAIVECMDRTEGDRPRS